MEIYKDRGISILFLLPRNAKMRITNIYWPANDADIQERREMKEWIIKLYEGDDAHTEQIMGGDWNTALDPRKDRIPGRARKDNGAEMIQEIMETCGVSDIYRILNPHTTQMSHSTVHNKHIINASRIDFFLVSQGIADRTIQTDTLVSDDTPTDHRPTFMEMRWEAWAKPMRRGEARRVPDIKEADDEDIEAYRKAVTKDCKAIADKLQRTIRRIGKAHIGNLPVHEDHANRMGITGPQMDERLWSEEQRKKMV